MTAISTIISNRGISFATDSMITIYSKRTREYKVIEYTKPKLIPVEKYHAALAYYGFAKYNNWSIYEWIKQRIQSYSQSLSLKQFAEILKTDLDKKLDDFFPNKYDFNRGIGIHLAGYETFGDSLLPELYHICNYTNPDYNEIGDMYVAPQLHGTLPIEYKTDSAITDIDKKNEISRFLNDGRLFIFNNGDPRMYNPLSNSFWEAYKVLKERNLTKSMDLELQRSLTRRPIEFIRRAQVDFCENGKRMIGGKIHDLTINKLKIYKSNSGDN